MLVILSQSSISFLITYSVESAIQFQEEAETERVGQYEKAHNSVSCSEFLEMKNTDASNAMQA